MTEEEKFANDLIIINDVFTNIVFNMGYIYQDIASIMEIWAAFGGPPKTTDRVDNLGIYIGDILIRFFWRRRFTRNFEYS